MGRQHLQLTIKAITAHEASLPPHKAWVTAMRPQPHQGQSLLFSNEYFLWSLFTRVPFTRLILINSLSQLGIESKLGDVIILVGCYNNYTSEAATLTTWSDLFCRVVCFSLHQAQFPLRQSDLSIRNYRSGNRRCILIWQFWIWLWCWRFLLKNTVHGQSFRIGPTFFRRQL